MKFIALYKTWQGEEFVTASLESIYNFVDKIVMVHSDVSWTGSEGNTVEPAVNEWAAENDTHGKIVNLYGSFTDQNKQYNFGLKYIHETFKFDFIMLVDTDEVWTSDQLERCKVYLERFGRRCDVFTTSLYTYVKTPFYRIVPQEMCRPTVFITPKIKEFTGARGWDIVPRAYIKKTDFHHFTFVRSSEEKVKEKLINSSVGDGSGIDQGQPLVENWWEDKWEKMPFVDEFHYQQKFAKVWKGLECITLQDLPESVRSKAIMSKFYPIRPLLSREDIELLAEITKDKILVVELGTGTGIGSITASLNAKKVITIDNETLKFDVGETHEEVSRRLSWYSNIERVKADVNLYAKELRDKTIDVLFIDAGHTYEDVMGNFNHYINKVKPNRLIAFHDYCGNYPDVVRAVDNISLRLDVEIDRSVGNTNIRVLRKL